jgi:hypothetical protein
MIWTIDPERITERIFGGPHFRAFEEIEGGNLRCPKTGKVWSRAAIAAGWSESRNVKAEAA